MKKPVISFGRNVNSVIEVRVDGIAVGHIYKREWGNESCWIYEDNRDEYYNDVKSASSVARLKQIISKELK